VAQHVRTPQQCFDESIAPVAKFIRGSWEAITGVSAVATVVRFTGGLTSRRGTVLRNFKGRPVFGGAMRAVGGFAFDSTVWLTAGVAGLASSYLAATSVICDINPNY
jgi:hypothetical protein